MYTEISLIISLGLILVLILIHFEFKEKLFDFENELKVSKKKYNKNLIQIKNNIDSTYTGIVEPIDCKGVWKCDTNCIKNFVVDVYPRYGGELCPIQPDDGNLQCTLGQDNCR